MSSLSCVVNWQPQAQKLYPCLVKKLMPEETQWRHLPPLLEIRFLSVSKPISSPKKIQRGVGEGVQRDLHSRYVRRKQAARC